MQLCIFNSARLLFVGHTLGGKILDYVCKIKEMGCRASKISKYAWILYFSPRADTFGTVFDPVCISEKSYFSETPQWKR